MEKSEGFMACSLKQFVEIRWLTWVKNGYVGWECSVVSTFFDGMVDGLNDLWHNMFWRDKIDVVTLGLILKFQHQIGDLLSFQLPPIFLLTDVPVLTEDTAEVAHAKEDCSGTVPSLQHRLLPKVGKCWADNSFPASIASSFLIFQSINFAIPWMKG